MSDLKVIRYCMIDPVTGGPTGDYLRVGNTEVNLREAVNLEYQRARRAHPENPAFNMRPMFHTGSRYGREILALFENLAEV